MNSKNLPLVKALDLLLELMQNYIKKKQFEKFEYITIIHKEQITTGEKSKNQLYC